MNSHRSYLRLAIPQNPTLKVLNKVIVYGRPQYIYILRLVPVEKALIFGLKDLYIPAQGNTLGNGIII
ncbi:MAG: hypothetical protein HUU50_15070, partial [Candidatus Brocadiae bacterium]|nr:hypothetical protein [Candidatus Brocadiia bacterium]